MLTAPHHAAQTSPRPGSKRALELERLYEARRGHAPQISISDDSHHITEAIGDMYGENEYHRSESRPLSFISSPTSETFDLSPSFPSSPNPLERASSNENKHHANGQPSSPQMLSPRSDRSDSFDRSSVSPPRLNRQSSDTASQAFEFQDIDSQSSPAAVAQELSNLQAIRRMSMDVHGSDPDLPSFSERAPMPPASPTHEDDEDDPSRMFWVPARVHPELAPKEFKTFIEEKVQKHRRRSGDSDSMLSADGLSPEGSGGGLRRKKSMLSKQVDGPHGYRDGAERLERKRSQASDHAHMPTLHQLEAVEEDDPAQLIRRMSLRDSMDSGVAGVESAGEDDVPILPVKPAGILKRSTRTNYRRGNETKSDKGDKKSRKADDDDDEESGGRKTSWGWFSRKNKEKEEQEEHEKKDKEEKEHKKTKSKLTKSADKSHDKHDKHDKHEKKDNTRLDVLQTSIDDGRGRESLVLDRSSVKLDEERQKTSSRKTSSEKKEKEGLFSSIFGGKTKKGEKEPHGSSKKAISARGLSPDPPQRVLRPDVDYNWTRFSILEERAIYRMAHIKLANPRRELYSQVLLSNFMYSYLAKVQQMHPHIQIGQSAAQKQQQRLAQEQKKREEEQRRQQQQQQPEEFKQYQMYQDVSKSVEVERG
ncbi:putative telomere silencing protein [Diplodia seriata]|uniref:Putative telomere silencing protein n=1 Tax=Diplodia seriata TaxID=420778 RepID=A0A0G2FQ78_9PEZI|nr:putative telomere silencing protein [Diplodia seriata]